MSMAMTHATKCKSLLFNENLMGVCCLIYYICFSKFDGYCQEKKYRIVICFKVGYFIGIYYICYTLYIIIKCVVYVEIIYNIFNHFQI